MKFTTSAIALMGASGASAFVQQSPTIRAKTTSLTSYLDDIGANAAPEAPVGFASYLDSMGSTSSRAGGAGIGNYLDSINQECNGAQGPSAPCAEAITDYMSAVASGDAPAESSTEAAHAIGNYLDHLAGQAAARLGGVGIQSYLATVATSPERAGGAGIANYLDTVRGVGTATATPTQSAPAIKVSCMFVFSC